MLVLPAVMGKNWLPPREAVYNSIWWESGEFPWIRQQVFEKTGDIDIAFIGASRITAAFDTPMVQEQLSKHLGRPATVLTLGWGGGGYDQLYFVAHDLLEHRKVKVLVFDDVYNRADQPHVLAPRLFRLADNLEAL
ncbi:MAG: hypothetical protein ABSH48_24830, partial [Verrucomicrobiota bacterium]